MVGLLALAAGAAVVWLLARKLLERQSEEVRSAGGIAPGPGAEPGPSPAAESGAEPGLGPATESGAGPGPGPVTESGADPGPGPATESGAEPGRGPAAESGRPADNGVPDLSQPSRAELYEQAKRLRIEGRSKMSKEELTRAVSRARNG